MTSTIGPGQLVDDRYRVVGVLARGGMASVYRGWDERLGRAVAIKVLDRPGSSPWQEARLTAAVNHPHVVPVYDSGLLPDGRPFLVMELVEGETLDHLAPLPLPDALRLTRQVVAALDAAHAVGVVHCDLKPRNVLVDRYGQARLTDFGVATVTATPTGAFVYGSAPYLAPERLRGAPATPSVDLYAAGALLYALLTGQPPYRAPDLPSLLARAEAGDPPPLTGRVAGATPALDRLLATALHPDPAQRFPATAALQTALAELEAAIVPARRGARRRPALNATTHAPGWLARQRRALGAIDWRRYAARVRAAAHSSVAAGQGLLDTARRDRRVARRVGLVSLVLLSLLLLLLVVVARQRAATTMAPGVANAPAAAGGTTTPTGVSVAPPGAGAPAAPSAGQGTLVAEATISDPTPPRSARMTVTGRLTRDGAPVAGAVLTSTWNFSSGPATCRGGETDTEGRASCTLSMSGARSGVPVQVDVYLEYRGQTVHATTTFVPR